MAYPWREDDEGLGWVGAVIQAGAAVTSLAVTTSTTLYTQRQDQKFQLAQQAAQNNITIQGMVADMALKDREMNLKEQQLAAEMQLAEEELAKLNAEREIQLQAAREQLEWIRAERARQAKIADAEAAIKIAVLDQQKQAILNDGALRDQEYKALQEQLKTTAATDKIAQANIRAEREALSREALAVSGAKKSKAPLVIGAGVAAAAAYLFLK